MGTTGAYVLDIYCDSERCDVHGLGPTYAQIVEANRQTALREARHQGWALSRTGKAICPQCRPREDSNE